MSGGTKKTHFGPQSPIFLSNFGSWYNFEFWEQHKKFVHLSLLFHYLCPFKVLLIAALPEYHMSSNFGFNWCINKCDLNALLILIPNLSLKHLHSACLGERKLFQYFDALLQPIVKSKIIFLTKYEWAIDILLVEFST